MKIIRLILITAFIFSISSIFGQTDKTNFLRNYKAPDYKFQSLIIKFQSAGNGNFNSDNKFNVRPSIQYNSYKNSKKSQGFSLVSFSNSINYSKATMSKTTEVSFRLNQNSFNRLYLNDKNYFVGYGNYLSGYQYNIVIKEPVENKRDGLFLNVNPTVSLGKGRVEPVHFARKSKDIERALVKSNTMGTSLSTEQSTILANKIAVLQNRRFFDNRLNRIYQLESIDSLLQEMDIIEDLNMKYFTYLSDAFLFTHNPRRLNGTQLEIGLTDGFGVLEQSEFNSGNFKDHAMYGFVSFAHYIAKNYKIQHDFRGSFIMGKRRRFGVLGSDDQADAELNFEYKIGYYPTTRTFLDVTALLGVTTNSASISSSDVNAFANVRGNLYYYFSPKLRFQAQAAVMIGESTNKLNIYNGNSDYSSSFESNHYSFSIGLDFAIF